MTHKTLFFLAASLVSAANFPSFAEEATQTLENPGARPETTGEHKAEGGTDHTATPAVHHDATPIAKDQKTNKKSRKSSKKAKKHEHKEHDHKGEHAPAVVPSHDPISEVAAPSHTEEKHA